MVRCVIGTMLLCVVTATADDAKDPVKEKLFAAKVAYDKDVTAYRRAVTNWFDKREDAARNAGDKKAVDQVKADRTAFEESGTLPKSSPADLNKQLASAQSSFEAAMIQAVKDYTKAKMDDEAAVVEKSLKQFRDSVGPTAHVRQALLGTWRVAVGPYKGDWTFNEDGTVDSSTNGPKAGTWSIDLAKKHVRIVWGKDLADKFDLPLNPKATIGSQIGRQNLKLDATKLP